MNNEIGRRDFMKLSAASIMTASVALNFGNTAFAATASENPKDVLKIFSNRSLQQTMNLG